MVGRESIMISRKGVHVPLKVFVVRLMLCGWRSGETCFVLAACSLSHSLSVSFSKPRPPGLHLLQGLSQGVLVENVEVDK